MDPYRSRRVPVPAVVVLLVVGLALLAVSCGDDSDDSASSTTASSTTVSTTSTPASASTTTASGADAGDGRVEVTIGGEKRTLTIEACSSGNSSSIELTANDDSGNTMTVTAADGQGSVTYRGSSQDREGAIRSVEIQADGTFDLGGILSVADDSAPGPDDLTVTGLCPA